jgi:hypothetical protein
LVLGATVLVVDLGEELAVVGELDEFPGLAQADAATASRPKSPSVTAFAIDPSLASIR